MAVTSTHLTSMIHSVPYQRRLLLFFSVASFFEGYDFLALSQVLPSLRATYGLSEGTTGLLFSVVNLGSVLAFFLIRKADHWGRKRVLTFTIAGYTVLTFASGLAPNVIVFALLQMAARVFLAAEYSVSLVMAAEEFPAQRRGFLLGVITGMSALGSIVCAGVVPALLQSPWGWRTVYLVSVVPLVLLAWARRELRETQRFSERAQATSEQFPWLRLWRSEYRARMLQVAMLWFVCHVPASLAVAFFKQYAVSELHWTDANVGNAVVIGAVGSLPLVFLTGRALDSFGRRVGGPLIFLIGALGIAGTYQLSNPVLLTLALTMAMYAAIAFFHVTNAVTTELFPTELRSDAYAWCNNIIGRCGYVLAPLIVGVAAGHVGWGNAVAPSAALFILAIWLLLRFIPETAGRELEDSARL